VAIQHMFAVRLYMVVKSTFICNIELFMAVNRTHCLSHQHVTCREA